MGLSNQRLLSIDANTVRFRTRGTGTATVTPEQFIGRMLLHVLPPRFVKIRHFGLLAPVHVNTRLVAARAALASHRPPPQTPAPRGAKTPEATWRERVIALTGKDPMRCPACGGLLHRSAIVVPVTGTDSS